MSKLPQDIRGNLRSELVSRGFDIVWFFSLDEYNGKVPEKYKWHQADSKGREAILIGNGRGIWPRFIEWLRADPRRVNLRNPMEDFVETSIGTVCRQVLGDQPIYWTHRVNEKPLPAQKLAHISGLAYLSAAKLNIHPKYGPWFALRALLILPWAPEEEMQIATNPCSPNEEEKSVALYQEILRQNGEPPSHEEIQNQWQDWLRIRDSFSVGRQYRYGEAQLRYHYTHDKAVLREELEKGS